MEWALSRSHAAEKMLLEIRRKIHRCRKLGVEKSKKRGQIRWFEIAEPRALQPFCRGLREIASYCTFTRQIGTPRPLFDGFAWRREDNSEKAQNASW
jgi:hypothetical protein